MTKQFFVVFDTCTQAAYYSDVHQVLALPEGAVIRYEYKRRLFKADAAAEIDRLTAHPSGLPLPVLLMYGQKQGFAQNSPEPTTMLSRADSVFIPTRAADLVAVFVDKGAEASEDILYLHLRLRGFVSPDAPAVQTLITALEADNALPFGDKATQYKWISLLPPALAGDAIQLTSNDQTVWPAVVDRFVTAPTQFKDDVFWRVRGLSEERGGGHAEEVKLVDRATNDRVHADRFRCDYPLSESKRYLVTIQTHSPQAHGANVPAGATIAMTSEDDDQALLKLAADPLPVVPNQVASKRFSISTDAAIDTRFTGIRLETQVPGAVGKFPPGSTCSLTFSIRKERWRLFVGFALMLLGTAIASYATGAKPDGWTSAALGVAGVLCLAVGGWLLTRQFKLGKS